MHTRIINVYYFYSADEKDKIYRKDRRAIEQELKNGLMVPNMFVSYKGLYEIAAGISKGNGRIYGYAPEDNYH